MKTIAVLALFCAFSDLAFAQAPECKYIPKASDRLACYDRAAPPTAVAKPTASQTPTPAAKPAGATDQGQAVDMLADENKKLDTKLKSLCRGC
jgi:hypothetical protein